MPFAADPSGAVHDQGFVRHDGQRDGEVAVGGFEDLRRGVPSRRLRPERFGAPSIDPHVQVLSLRSRFAESGPAELFRVLKPALLQVTHGKVREVQLRDGPFRGQCLDLIRRDSAAKERELVAEGAAVFRREVPRVVPPFGAECIVRAVVARKLVAISFSGLSEGTVVRRHGGNETEAAEEEQQSWSESHHSVSVYGGVALITCGG